MVLAEMEGETVAVRDGGRESSRDGLRESAREGSSGSNRDGVANIGNNIGNLGPKSALQRGNVHEISVLSPRGVSGSEGQVKKGKGGGNIGHDRVKEERRDKEKDNIGERERDIDRQKERLRIRERERERERDRSNERSTDKNKEKENNQNHHRDNRDIRDNERERERKFEKEREKEREEERERDEEKDKDSTDTFNSPRYSPKTPPPHSGINLNAGSKISLITKRYGHDFFIFFFSHYYLSVCHCCRCNFCIIYTAFSQLLLLLYIPFNFLFFSLFSCK